MTKKYALMTDNVKDIMPFFRLRSGLQRNEILRRLNVTSPTFKKWEDNPDKIPARMFDNFVEIYGDDFVEFYMDNKLYNKQ